MPLEAAAQCKIPRADLSKRCKRREDEPGIVVRSEAQTATTLGQNRMQGAECAQGFQTGCEIRKSGHRTSMPLDPCEQIGNAAIADRPQEVSLGQNRSRTGHMSAPLAFRQERRLASRNGNG
ncbi:hypothetical protein Tasa_053_007 [Tanticharoenia sakaeratensis NBRC 103193]|uniref:Uncharacterized protein n=1 Tax=Tanticharoenia sakaeratensis NBRC 103193 TaxID=1231623 RepID=A0A0D6MPN7_9PROT|nr:hypothetical protein Tasa_053_007 [Tanticharoenia sakaeratensis NBRC 103193]